MVEIPSVLMTSRNASQILDPGSARMLAQRRTLNSRLEKQRSPDPRPQPAAGPPPDSGELYSVGLADSHSQCHALGAYVLKQRAIGSLDLFRRDVDTADYDVVPEAEVPAELADASGFL